MPRDPQERQFTRAIDSLADVVRFVDAYTRDSDVPTGLVPVIQLVIEEVFTNMVRHNADGIEAISIRLARGGEELTMTITDRDAPRFDIRDHDDVDVTAPLRDRKPGGLGIHLVKHLVDEIRYHYKDGVSEVTLIKLLEPSHA